MHPQLVQSRYPLRVGDAVNYLLLDIIFLAVALLAPLLLLEYVFQFFVTSVFFHFFLFFLLRSLEVDIGFGPLHFDDADFVGLDVWILVFIDIEKDLGVLLAEFL